MDGSVAIPQHLLQRYFGTRSFRHLLPCVVYGPQDHLLPPHTRCIPGGEGDRIDERIRFDPYTNVRSATGRCCRGISSHARASSYPRRTKRLLPCGVAGGAEWQAKLARVAAGEESGVCESCES